MKQDVLFSFSIFPKGFLPSDYSHIIMERIPSSGAYVHKGDNLVRFTICRWIEGRMFLNEEPISEYILTSDYEGYVYFEGGEYTWSVKKEGTFLLSIYTTLDEIIVSHYGTTYSIQENEFSLEKEIVFSRIAGQPSFGSQKGFRIGVSMSLLFSVKNNQPVLIVYFNKKDLSITKRDTIVFKFEDNSLLALPVTNAAAKTNDFYFTHSVVLPLTNKDISTFAEKGWEKIKIEHINDDAPCIIRNRYDHYGSKYSFPLSALLFKLYAGIFQQALNELNIGNSECIKPINDKLEEAGFKDEPCYVYLMEDTSNGYHKIGISNHPEYRERTLQSEKPTIEKVCAKQFPSRQIATAIESALHTSFAAKRVRGEWFNLSPSDVAQIIETLR